jgi:hypothetical protein
MPRPDVHESKCVGRLAFLFAMTISVPSAGAEACNSAQQGHRLVLLELLALAALSFIPTLRLLIALLLAIATCCFTMRGHALRCDASEKGFK